MHALDALASRRVESWRVNRSRWHLLPILLVVIGFGALVSVGVSFWVFFMSEVPVTGSNSFRTEAAAKPMSVKTLPLLGEVHPFFIESFDAIHEEVKRTIAATIVYPHLNNECLKNAPKWIHEVSTLADDSDLDDHWSFRTKFILIVTSAECPPATIREMMDSDPLTAGMKIVWFGLNLVDEEYHLPKDQLLYPASYFHGEVGTDAPLEKEQGLVWSAGDYLTKLDSSQFCMYDESNMWAFIMKECIPVVNKDLQLQLPFSKLVRWESVTVTGLDADNLHNVHVKRNALSAVHNLMKELSEQQQFTFNLAFS